MRMWCRAAVLAVLPSVALAEVAPECQGLPKPTDYDEQVQQDFQQNYFALSQTFSTLHGAVPHAPGRGSIGIDASILPPLACAQRFVLEWTKTEEVNKSPILPKIVGSYSFPAAWKIVVPYASVAFFPSIPFNGTRNLLISGELGVGVMAHPFFDVGARFHISMLRTYGDVATAFDPATEPAVEDVFVGSTWGVDAVASVPIEYGKQVFTPFVAGGYLDASTYFFVGDDNFVGNNLHPYSGFAFSVGLDMLLQNRLRLGGEFYGAPGGYSLPDPTATSVDNGSRYGKLYTARFRIGYEF